MDDKRYTLPGRPVLTLSCADADRLLKLRDGDAALLYLYILRCGGVFSPGEASRALDRTELQLRDAAGRLRGAGLLVEEQQHVLSPAEELPEYKAEEVVRRSREDPTFRALVSETQRLLGHSLSGADLKTLFGIYDRLGLPADVIMLLINHCAEKARRRYGEGRLPSMRFIEKEAFYWVNREIVTMAQAEAYLESVERREQEGHRILEALQITGREPTVSEQRYIDDWQAMGFSPEAIAVAYDRTVVSTGKLSWPYMNKILRSWYEKGLFTPEEIEKGDSRGHRRSGGSTPARGGTASVPAGGDDLDRLERILNKDKR